MPPTTGRVDVPAARTLLGEVAAAMAGLPPSAPADLDGARSRHTELVVGDALPGLRARVLAAVAHLPCTPDPSTVRAHRHGTGDFTLPRRAGGPWSSPWRTPTPTGSRPGPARASTGSSTGRAPPSSCPRTRGRG